MIPNLALMFSVRCRQTAWNPHSLPSQVTFTSPNFCCLLCCGRQGTERPRIPMPGLSMSHHPRITQVYGTDLTFRPSRMVLKGGDGYGLACSSTAKVNSYAHNNFSDTYILERTLQANIVFSTELARRYGSQGIISIAVNPGM
jgi:hypothetical protein